MLPLLVVLLLQHLDCIGQRKQCFWKTVELSGKCLLRSREFPNARGMKADIAQFWWWQKSREHPLCLQGSPGLSSQGPDDEMQALLGLTLTHHPGN